MAPANADQVTCWNGPTGERWAREQAAIDRAFAALTARLLAFAALKPGEHVLDVGCGCGVTTLAAVDAVGPTGAVLGIDVSAPMLARARDRSAGRPNIAYVEGDASTRVFEATCEVVLSRLGVMFFRDPVAAFANLRTALGPGGRVAFLCWRPAADNEWVRLPYDAAAQHLPAEPAAAPDEPGPFAFGDRARVEGILAGAGFTSVAVTPLDAEIVLSEEGLDAAVQFVMTVGPTSHLFRESTDDATARARRALQAALRPRLRGERLTLAGATWLVRAQTNS
jgi:SAM-dependent methyltransferase